MTRQFACIFAGLTLTVSALANSSDSEERDIFVLSLEQLLQVKISASTLTDKQLQRVPSAVTVFTSEQIARLGVKTVAQLMNFVPGFQSQRSADNGGYTMASSRNRRTAAVSTEILIVVDGYRTQSHLHSGSSLFLELPLENIEKVEFIRGPGSALYGSNAMMGVVNIITKKNATQLSARSGSNGNADLGILFGNSWDKASLDFHSVIQSSQGQGFSLFDAFSAEPVEASDPFLNTNSIFKATVSNFKLHLQHRYWKSEEFYVLESLDEQQNKVGVDYFRTAASFVHSLFGIDSKFSVYYVDYQSFNEGKQSDYGAFSLVSNPSSDAALLFSSESDSDERDIAWDMDWEISQNNRLLMGLDWRSERIENIDVKLNFDYPALLANNFPINYYPDFQEFDVITQNFNRQTVVGHYFQWLSTVREKNHFTLGFRYDRYKELDKSKATPRFAWVHELNDDHSLKLLYAHAFRAPTIDNLNSNSSWSRGSPTLEAETVKTFELIWSGKNQNAFWSLGYFNSRFKDPILLIVPDENDNTSRILANSEHDNIAGLEFELTYEPTKNILLRTTATSIFQSDEMTFRESSELLSFEINYSRNRWNTNLALAWRGDRETYDPAAQNERRLLDDYLLSHFKLQYKVSDVLSIIGSVNNLLDDDVYYASPGSRIPQGIPARGREVELGFHWQY